MGTRVLKLECKKHGAYQIKTTDAQGNTLFAANGAIHDFVPNRKITRTFEMENLPFGVQFELLEFEKLTDDTSKLKVHAVYESAAQRDQVLKMGMSQGANMAHNRLQAVIGKLK